MKLRVRVLFIYGLIISLAVGLSALIYLSGRAVNSTANYLVEENLPKLKEINQVYASSMQNELLLYEFYASTNKKEILPKLEKNRRQLDQGLSSLQARLQHHPRMATITEIEYRNVELVHRITETLKNDRIDWDLARELLAQLSKNNQLMTDELNNLIADSNTMTIQSASSAQDTINFSTRIVIGFTALILVVSFFIGYYINLYLKDSNSRRRLASFTQRNPNPTLSLDWQGQIKYANDACYDLMEQMDNFSQRPESLLPSGFKDLLLRYQKTSEDHHSWIADIDERIFKFSMSLLRDLGTCHLYLEDITEKTNAERQLVYQAHHDVVTELPNKRYFLEHLTDNVIDDPSNPAQDSYALLLLQIDNFDLYTASYSMNKVDELIKSCALTIQHALLGSGLAHECSQVFRVDSIKFAILIKDITDEEKITQIAQHIQKTVHHGIKFNAQELFINLCVGVAMFPEHAKNGEQLFTNADAALTRAKSNQEKHVVHYSDDIYDKEQNWMRLENELRTAIEKDELTLFFQPQICTTNETIHGVEALLRWFKPDGRFISPVDFIPVAERSGLIIPMGRWIIEQCFKQYLLWKKQKPEDPLSVAINISARQFAHPEFIHEIELLLKEYPVDPGNIEMEITESLLMGSIEKSIEVMCQLKALGFKLSIDDFGTGYSSLSYLKQFPINKLKIDREFIMQLENDSGDRAIVKTIIDLAHNLDLAVIAEGVENEEQLHILKDLECESIQGFFFSKPEAPNIIEERYFKNMIQRSATSA